MSGCPARAAARGGRAYAAPPVPTWSGGWLVLGAVACALLGSGCTKKLRGAAPADAASDATSQALDAGTADGGDDAGAPTATEIDGAMPAAGSDELTARMRHLLEAITQNNPDLAGDVVFPRDAWILTRDETDPQRSWDKRVKTPFGRSVERLHKRVKNVEHARFVSFAIGQAVIQVQPRKHELKRPLWRVRHSKLLFSVDGKPQSVEIAEMTSWRGAWYVTKLR